MPKFGGTTIEGPSQARMPKFKLFNCLSKTHEIFRINKCEEKIKFDKTLGYHNGEVLFKQHCQT